jgi:hypothetical protein
MVLAALALAGLARAQRRTPARPIPLPVPAAPAPDYFSVLERCA